MADEPSDTITITVKSVPQATWERAKRAAMRQGETMGEWIARACEQLATRESEGPREIVPVRSGHPDQIAPPETPAPVDPMALVEIMKAAEAISQSSGVPVPTRLTRSIYALLGQAVRSARGPTRNPPRMIAVSDLSSPETPG